MTFKRSIYLYLCLLLGVLSMAAGTPAEDFASAVRGKVGVMVIDLKADTVVTAINMSEPLTPASITKSLTIASTLRKSGPDYKYHTRVYATGPIKDGVLEGNLLIVGGGDPSLGADVDPKGTDICSEIAEALRKHHVREIKGRIITDSSIFTDSPTHPTWGSGDLAHSYGTGCHGLNYRRNASGKSAVKNPQGVLVATINKTLGNSGITVAGDTIASTERKKELLNHVSPPVSEIMRSCMMRSDNLYAEALLRTYALLETKNGATDAGAKRETEYWTKKGAPMSGVKIVDGSGLSRSNKLTANFLAYVLAQMADDEVYASFFPLAGQEGTVRNLFKNTQLDSYVALKTGTMRGVRCLAGYKLDDEFAPTHAIVIIANDCPGGAAAVNKAAQKMLLDIFYPEAADYTQSLSTQNN
ncbi:MAG: D-alanyl-D-alanine carboxypeptidase/D-alanyl-D-alanine-endopeptidase [Bacteroidales bacterium]|nr:D-alanyl-D-alanine carboxypeptidase/D-alanyl-D-alanine-endopeptidase [Bacteroidales bacterium]